MCKIISTVGIIINVILCHFYNSIYITPLQQFLTTTDCLSRHSIHAIYKEKDQIYYTFMALVVGRYYTIIDIGLGCYLNLLHTHIDILNLISLKNVT
jgi:hypothetical protein